MRIGIGYDIHRLVQDRKLIIGGVEIPYHLGLLGHSDADVLYHSIADAIFGALALPDIGHYFPNTDMSIRGVSSDVIVNKAVSEAKARGYCVSNIDTCIIAEAPKMKPYVEQMKKNIAKLLEIDVDCVGIKATTNERVGDIGNGAAIAVHATCLLLKAKQA